MSAPLEWTTWREPRGQRLHTAPGEFNGEAGSWRIIRQHGTLEVWFRPSGRRRRGRFITTAKTLAAAKAEAEALA